MSIGYTFAQAVSVPGCEAVDRGGRIDFPCGLSYASAAIPGVFWGPIRVVHEQYHASGRTDRDWTILETTDTNGATVTVTFSASAPSKE